MENYILKLNSGTEYKLYKGTTLVSDANLTTLFGTAGEMYLSFDFNSGTPSDLTTLTITDSSDIAVISNSNLTNTIAEGKNYKATWSNSATTFDTFEELEGKALDESQLSFLMEKIKWARQIPVKVIDTAGTYKLNDLVDELGLVFAINPTVANVKIKGSSPTSSIVTLNANTRNTFVLNQWGGFGLFLKGGSSSYLQLISDSYLTTFNILDSHNIVDNLATTSSALPLSANQGRILNNRIGDLTTLTTTAKTNAVAAINEVNGKAVGTSETLTIATTDWTALSASDPYDYSATVTATTTISATSTVELINDQAVLFGTYGFAIGSVSGQSITFYSIGQPSASVSLTIKVRS